MPLKNTHALFLLSLFVGLATDMGLIGAQSLLLSYADAVYAIYCGLTGYLLFSLLLKNFHRFKLKFAHFAIIALSLFCLLLAGLTQEWITGFPKAIVWFVAALFGLGLLRWIVSELTLRYLDPARANSYFSYLTACFEGSTLLVLLYLRFTGRVLDANQTLILICFCCLVSVVLIAMQFLPRRNFEILYAKPTTDNNEKEESTNLKPLLVSYILMSAAFATAEISEVYLVSTIVKHELQTYQAIRSMTDNYFAMGCALIVIFSIVTGKAIERQRISSARLLSITGGIVIGMSIICLITGQFYLFILFEVLRRTSEYCLYRPANQMVLGSFVGNLRPRLTAQHSLFYYVIVRGTMAAVFTATNLLAFNIQKYLVLFIILISAIASMVALRKFREYFTAAMYRFLESNHKARAIIAANMLSYLRPKDFITRMDAILTAEPKKLLRKTIVLGLGYVRSEDSVNIIEKEFEAEKEEIQIAALDALRVSGKYQATQFMLNILLTKATPKTQRVRLNAMAVIRAIYGKKAIPILLNGLDDPDPRVVANTLEVLSDFHAKDLKRHFLKFVESEIPRVKANALLGLAKFQDTRTLYREKVRSSLRDGNLGLSASMIYVIGRLKDKEFRQDLLDMFARDDLRSHPVLMSVLAWALIKLNEKQGFELADQLLSAAGQSRGQTSFMHFFSLCTQQIRYDILKYLVNAHGSDDGAVHRVGERLKHSIYDFHEELEFLKVYSQSMKQSLRKSA